MPSPEHSWLPKISELEGNLLNLRRLLDRAMPPLAVIPELARTAGILCPSTPGMEGVHGAIELALKRLPQDGVPEVARILYGLTDNSKGKRVKERRKLAHKKYLTTAFGQQKRHKLETFRTEDEPKIVQDIAGALADLVQGSYAPAVTDQKRVGPDEFYLKLLADKAADLFYACRAALFVQKRDMELSKKGTKPERPKLGFPLIGFLFEKYLAFAYTLYPMPDPYMGLCFADFFLANGYRHQQLDPALAKQLVDLWRQGADASPIGQVHRTPQERLRLTAIALGGQGYEDEPLYTENWYRWLGTIRALRNSNKYMERELAPMMAASGAIAVVLERNIGLYQPNSSAKIFIEVSQNCYEQYGAPSVFFDMLHHFAVESRVLIAELLPEVSPEDMPSI